MKPPEIDWTIKLSYQVARLLAGWDDDTMDLANGLIALVNATNRWHRLDAVVWAVHSDRLRELAGDLAPALEIAMADTSRALETLEKLVS